MPLGVAVPLGVPVLLGVALGELDGVTLGVTVVLRVRVGVGVGVAVPLGVPVLLGVALGELDGVTLGVTVVLRVRVTVVVGEHDTSAVAPPRHDEGQPQAEQDDAPPVEKVPAGQGVGFTEDSGQ